MKEKYNIEPNTLIACLTYEQFIDAIKTALSEPIEPKDELPKFLNVAQLSKLTGYAESTIHIKNSKKEIPGCSKPCGRLLFDRDIILEWIESGTVKTKDQRLQELSNKMTDKKRIRK